MPTYGESEEILADTLRHLVDQEVGGDKQSVVLAFEERDPAAHDRARALEARFAEHFAHFVCTFHPDLPGEVKGKSSNLAWAAQRVQEALVATGALEPTTLLVTVCDADSRLHSKYLTALGYKVASDPRAELHVFQPAILFYANHWRLVAPLRALNSIYSLYELARMVPSHRLVTQSTYSMAWSVAAAVGFWDVDIIPEDSHMFFKVHVPLRPAGARRSDLPARLRRRGRRRHPVAHAGQYLSADSSLGVGRLRRSVRRLRRRACLRPAASNARGARRSGTSRNT